jgi:hypothetical protein
MTGSPRFLSCATLLFATLGATPAMKVEGTAAPVPPKPDFSTIKEVCTKS